MMKTSRDPRITRYYEELIKVNFRCKACGADLTKISFHLDHIFPKSKGGSEESWNFQILCAFCNISKGAKTMKSWAPWLLKDGKLINTWEELGWASPVAPPNESLVELKVPKRKRRQRPKSTRINPVSNKIRLRMGWAISP